MIEDLKYIYFLFCKAMPYLPLLAELLSYLNYGKPHWVWILKIAIKPFWTISKNMR